MASVILTNTLAQTSIGTSPAANKLIKLDKNKLQTGGIKLLPQLDHIVVYVTASGAIASATGRLYWDAAGDRLAYGSFTLSAIDNLTTASTYCLSASLPVWLSPASNNRASDDAGCLYLSIVVNANTVDVAAGDVELYCHDNLTFTG